MAITLSPELQARIERLIATGRYGSVDEVVTEALRLLDRTVRDVEHDDGRTDSFSEVIEEYQVESRAAKRADVLRKIDEGLASIAAGRTLPAKPVDELIAEFEAKVASARKR